MHKSNLANPETVTKYASAVIDAQAAAHRRYLLGIVGAPAAGKSTFAAQLVEAVNEKLAADIAVVVPMDGFHYSNEELDKRDLRPLKGIPTTFDSNGFVNLIAALKIESGESVFCPLFDRSIEASIEKGIEIKPQHEIIVSEGNYLLLNEKPWNELPKLFDEIWFIESSLETLMPRLIQRHKSGGRNEQQTKEKIESTDLPNAKLIESTKARATKIISI